MSNVEFIETLEYRRYIEFSEACRRYRYIELCYGPPGVGKTLSGRQMSRAAIVEKHDPWRDEPIYGPPLDTLFYTPPVVNSPAQLEGDLGRAREKLLHMARGPLRRQEEIALDTIRLRNQEYRRAHSQDPPCRPGEEPTPTYRHVAEEYAAKKLAIGDPTTLVLIDEADDSA